MNEFLSDRENLEKLPPIEPKQQENWFKIIKYEYYKRHMNSIVKYSSIEPEIKMTKKEIYNYLEIKNLKD